ncbi:hypothetical protein [Borrelia hermsii]|uniref:P26 n=3 Tax=Borrelia hermsii TaxID=140 RepID=A0AAN0X5Q0_BORHE|nr:hypothetical protein [Borrelia hermsii]AAX16849.1 hypothetical protein BH0336 [Borrelia hermsii DAH]AHH12356.1 Putative Outer Membrane Protein [Borrelia hermsii YBT]AJW73148.1 hypothetical protein L283_01645 [Borrelia hermsii CC1]AMR75500.1 hypothetical protein A0V01_02675 [Borrelia hermsii]ANA43148.1 hypothetical protein AXX13_01645 [Borrelia hermsii HS1]
MERTLKWLFYFIFFFFNIANVCSQGYIIENFDLSLNEFLEVSTRKDNLLPIVDSKRVIMFYPPSKGIRKVFAAFDFDSYAKKYLFKKNKYGLFFVKINLPHGVGRIKYRLVVDGIWTNDEYNKNVVFNKDLIPFSIIDIGVDHSYVSLRNPIDSSDGREVEIFYIGRPGQIITIAGNFNNFNPFLNRLVEQEPHKGVYTIKLKDLPKGRIYYYFVDSGNKVIDKNNVNRINLYSVEGLDNKIDFEVSYFDN